MLWRAQSCSNGYAAIFIGRVLFLLLHLTPFNTFYPFESQRRTSALRGFPGIKPMRSPNDIRLFWVSIRAPENKNTWADRCPWVRCVHRCHFWDCRTIPEYSKKQIYTNVAICSELVFYSSSYFLIKAAAKFIDLNAFLTFFYSLHVRKKYYLLHSQVQFAAVSRYNPGTRIYPVLFVGLFDKKKTSVINMILCNGKVK